jgi:hypothetical protein
METLLDLRALEPHFERIFGDVSIRQAWFTQLLQTAFVSTITGDYKDFGAVGSAALGMVASHREIKLSQEDRSSILEELCGVRPNMWEPGCLLDKFSPQCTYEGFLRHSKSPRFLSSEVYPKQEPPFFPTFSREEFLS